MYLHSGMTEFIGIGSLIKISIREYSYHAGADPDF